MITLYSLATWNEQLHRFRDPETHAVHEDLVRDLHWSMHHPGGDQDEPCLHDGDEAWCPGPGIRERIAAKDLVMRGWRPSNVFEDTERVHGPIDVREPLRAGTVTAIHRASVDTPDGEPS